MKHLIMIGAGAFGRECYWYAQDCLGYGEEFDLKGYLDDTPEGILRKDLLQMPRLDTIDNYEIQDDDVFICTVGDSQNKSKIVNRMKNRGGKFINLIHKTVIIHPTAKIGNGVIILSHCCLHDYSITEDFVTFNIGALSGHDCKVGKFSSLMSYVNLGGGTQIGERVFVAMNSSIIPQTIIEDDAYIGAGSVVLKNVGQGWKVFGNPARRVPN